MISYDGFHISIHAPTRGATGEAGREAVLPLISIHAPTRGATLYVCNNQVQNYDFNPRSYKRSDGSAFRFRIF